MDDTKVIPFDLSRLEARPAENFTIEEELGILISMADERDKRTPKEALREFVREAVEQHVANHYLAERAQLIHQIDELTEIVKSYQKAEATCQKNEQNRIEAHREAMRQAEARVVDQKESFQQMRALFEDREDIIRHREQQIRTVLLGKTTPSQMLRSIRTLVGIEPKLPKVTSRRPGKTKK